MNWRKEEFKQRKKDRQKQLWGSAARKNYQKYQKYQKKESIHEYRPQTKPKKNHQKQKNRDEHKEKEKGPTTQQNM